MFKGFMEKYERLADGRIILILLFLFLLINIVVVQNIRRNPWGEHE